MPPIDVRKVIEEASRKTSEDQFWATRGKAVQAYARLEQALCRVFSDVSATSEEIAAIIFFRVASASGAKSDSRETNPAPTRRNLQPFLEFDLQGYAAIDGKRNEIVHWVVMSKLDLSHDGSPAGFVVMLRPPTYWSTLDDSAPQITTVELLEFIKRCDFYSFVIDAFAEITAKDAQLTMPADVLKSWLDIFHKPIVYPLPLGNLPGRIPEEPDSQPESSQA